MIDIRHSLSRALPASMMLALAISAVACDEGTPTWEPPTPGEKLRGSPGDVRDDEEKKGTSVPTDPAAPPTPPPGAEPPAACTLDFGDVGPGHAAHESVRNLFVNGIVGGCSSSPLLYCPDSASIRKDTAIMLVRLMKAEPSTAAANAYFDDVAGDAKVGYVNRLSELGITSGCGTRKFCPNEKLLRDQLASFIVRATKGTTSTVANNAYFDDIAGNVHAGSINRLKELGITQGCGERKYCPDQAINRDALAVMFTRAFKLDDGVCRIGTTP